jgi:hypothetical protein
MDHFAGLDVSVKETSACVVDDTGKIVREVTPGNIRANGVRTLAAWCLGRGCDHSRVRGFFSI